MSNFRLFETNEFLKQRKKMGAVQPAFVERKCGEYVYPQIRAEPHFGPNIKKLVGYKPETWRYRIGKLRLFYLIDEKTRVVSVLTVEFRKDAY